MLSVCVHLGTVQQYISYTFPHIVRFNPTNMRENVRLMGDRGTAKTTPCRGRYTVHEE